MHRLKTILLLSVSMLCAFAFAQNEKQNDGQNNKKPNILLIMTDQHQAEALSIAGNTNLNTPNLDKLAKQGVRFEITLKLVQG